MSATAAKAELRRRVLSELRRLPAEYVQEASALLRAKLIPLLRGIEHICIYAPLPHEVNLLPLLDELPGSRFYFPRCLPGRQLVFHCVQQPASQLEPGAHGILAPRAELPSIAPESVGAIIVPGVAFTAQGKRLGYGGGYYDRFLPRCPQALALATALPEQLVDHLPTDTHDCCVQTISIDD